MKQWCDLVREFIEESAKTQDKLVVSELAEAIKGAFPAEFSEEGARLADRGLRQQIRSVLNRLAQDPTEQMEFEAAQLPTVLAIRDLTGEVVYKLSQRCHWSDLIAARSERDNHIKDCVGKLDRFDRVLDRLRPLMMGTDKTVGDVFPLLQEQPGKQKAG